MFLRNSGVNTSDRATFANMVYGKAHKPFVYRTLLPSSVRVMTRIIPIQLRTRLNLLADHSPIVHRVLTYLRWEQQVNTKEYFTETIIALSLMLGSLIGFIYALKYFLTTFYAAPKMFINTIPLVTVLLLYPFFKFGYLYDFPSLFLFTLALAFMVRERWNFYLLIFLLASLNKETAFLLTLVFIPYYYEKKKIEPRQFWNLLLLQVGIYIFIKFVLFYAFSNNPGVITEFHLVENTYIILLRILGHPVITVGSWLILAFAVFYRWREKPEFLKYSLWIFLPLFLLYLLFGNYGELRVFYEVFPIFVLLIAHTIASLAKINLIKTTS